MTLVLRTEPMTRKEFLDAKSKMNRTIEDISSYLKVAERTVYQWFKGEEKMTLLASVAVDHMLLCELPAPTKRARRPNMNFLEMGFQIGDRLEFRLLPELDIRVVHPKKLRVDGVVMSFTKLRAHIVQTYGLKAPASSKEFFINGVELGDRYDTTYGSK